MILFQDTTGMMDASSALASLSQSFPAIIKLINVGASLMGLAITITGLFKFTKLKPAGESHLITAVLWVFVGSALLNLGSSVTSGLMTVFGAQANAHHLLAYTDSSELPAASKQLIQVLISAARIYGLIAAIKGLATLRHVGDPNFRQENPLKGGLVRFGFGCLLINIVQTVSVAATTFGWGHPGG